MSNILYIFFLGDLYKQVKNRHWSSRSWDQLKRELLEAFGSYCVWFPSSPEVAFCRSPDYTFSLYCCDVAYKRDLCGILRNSFLEYDLIFSMECFYFN